MRRIAMSVGLMLVLSFANVRAGTASTISVGARIDLSPTSFVVPIEISGAVDLFFWQADLLYDASDVQINESCDPFSGDVFCSFFTGPITEGPFFSSLSPFNVFNPGFVTQDPATLAQAGRLLAVNDTFGGSLPGPLGDGVLAYVEFITIGNGQSPITLAPPAPTAAVPEPATLTLLTVGLAMVSRRRHFQCHAGENRPHDLRRQS